MDSTDPPPLGSLLHDINNKGVILEPDRQTAQIYLYMDLGSRTFVRGWISHGERDKSFRAARLQLSQAVCLPSPLVCTTKLLSHPAAVATGLGDPIGVENDCTVAQCVAEQTIRLVVWFAASTLFVPSQYHEREIGEVVK